MSDFSLIHLSILLMRAFIQVIVFIKVVLYALNTILKYVTYKFMQCILWVYHSDNFRKCDGKLNSHNKNFFSLSICAVAHLIINKQINIETIIMFIYGLISEGVRDLMSGVLLQPKCGTRGKAKMHQQHIVSRMVAATNILIDFSLDVLQLTLKCGLQCGRPFVDPIVPKLSGAICCTNVRAATIALKCVSIIISKHMSLELLDAAISVFGTIFFLPMQSVFKSIVNILWNHQKKKW